jgi:hypothetical protein
MFPQFIKLHSAANYDYHEQSVVKSLVIKQLCLTLNYYRNI